jgi:ATP-dependent DNA ligase
MKQQQSGIDLDRSNYFIEPMLASKPKDGKGVNDFSPNDWLMEEKFDGHRLIVKVEAGKSVTAWSRVGNERALSPKLVKAIKESLPTCTLDSELYLPGGTSTDVTTIETLGKLELMFFDILLIEGASAMGERSDERRRLLEAATKHIDGVNLRLAEQYEPSEEKLHELWNRGGEGAILKKIGPYEPGKRSRNWVKLKKEGSSSFVLKKFEAGLNGPYSRMIGVAEGKYPISVKTLNRRWLHEFERNPSKYIGATVLFDFQNRTSDGNFRHPMVDRFEQDDLTPR